MTAGVVEAIGDQVMHALLVHVAERYERAEVGRRELSIQRGAPASTFGCVAACVVPSGVGGAGGGGDEAGGGAEVAAVVAAGFAFARMSFAGKTLIFYLFLLQLMLVPVLLIVPNRRMLLTTVSAFTAAHSITLAIAALFSAAPAAPLLNTLIALSILFLAIEILRRQRGATSLTLRHPWVAAFTFGLLHGFGFASGLLSLGLPRSELPRALFLFNFGVEIGQIAFILLLLSLRRAFRLMEIRWPRPLAALPTYAVGTLGAFWTFLYGFQLFAGGL